MLQIPDLIDGMLGQNGTLNRREEVPGVFVAASFASGNYVADGIAQTNFDGGHTSTSAGAASTLNNHHQGSTHRVKWGLPRRPWELADYRQTNAQASTGQSDQISRDVSMEAAQPPSDDPPQSPNSDAVVSVGPAVAEVDAADGITAATQESDVGRSSSSDSDLHSMSHYTARRESPSMEMQPMEQKQQSSVLAPESPVAAAPVGEVPDSAGGQSQVEEIDEDSDETDPVLAAAERQRRLEQNEVDAATIFIKHSNPHSSEIWGFGDLRRGDVWRHEYAPYFVVVAALNSRIIDAELCCGNLGVSYYSVEGAYRRVVQKVASLMSSHMFMSEAQGRTMAAADRGAAVGSSLGRLERDESILKLAPPNLPKHQLITWQNHFFKQIVSAMVAEEGVIVDERICRQALSNSRFDHILSEIGYLIEESDSSEEERL
ncbi:hypothetical protein MP228_009120 [Amoeboaphelidium protococcarum]|nr:hypothetical protein MP228_009120 [Amoeboaphelidium protococcarum]